MAFELNAAGNIDSNPLVSYDCGTIAGAGCLLRLVLARRDDPPQTGSISVQLTMSAEQAQQLVQDLQKMLDQIAASPKPDRPH